MKHTFILITPIAICQIGVDVFLKNPSLSKMLYQLRLPCRPKMFKFIKCNAGQLKRRCKGILSAKWCIATCVFENKF